MKEFDCKTPEQQTLLKLDKVILALTKVRPICTVYAHCTSKHVQQIYTGLYALNEIGAIRLKQSFNINVIQNKFKVNTGKKGLFSKTANGLFVDIEGLGLIFLDVRDSSDFYMELLDHVAVYAKRSFRCSQHTSTFTKFIPFGLYFPIFPDRTSFLEMQRMYKQYDFSLSSTKQLISSLARVFPLINRKLGIPTADLFSRNSSRTSTAKAIFLCRTWDPKEVPFDDQKTRQEINDFRASCIRQLNIHLGDRFFGGFQRSRHSLFEYPDCVVDANIRTNRRNYLKRLMDCSVCVATTGLYESIGAKFAEYVALSKSIVTEPLKFELPGPIKANRNYLEFDTPEACIKQVTRLLDDDTFRLNMMERNTEYYKEYGMPVAIIARVLYSAIE